MTEKIWLNVIESNMRIVSVCIDNMEDRVKWKFKTWVAGSKQLE